MRPLKLALALSLLAAPLLAQPGVVASPRWKPPVANLAALPATGNTIGDTRVALDTMVHYTWDGDSWETAASGGGAGTVTSVALAVPAEWTVSGSPVTTSGTITIAEATQTANTVYAGPASGGAAAPGFRSLVSDDIPNNAADTSGNAATATTAATASDISCTDCIGGTEIDESALGTVPTATAAATATALAANGANCSAGSYPLGVDASGAVESCTADDTGTDDQTATEVAYTPTTGTDWTDPDPTTVGGGLDALASRLTTEEAKADDDVPESGDFGAAADLEADGSLSADVVAAAEMADADHGDVSWSGGVATVDSGAVGLTEISDDATCSGSQAVRRNAGDTAFECYTASGGIGGTLSATDLAIAINNGTGGATLQSSATTCTVAGTCTAPSGQAFVAPKMALGGLTSSFPGLVQSGVGGTNYVTAVLADGSNWTGVQAGSFQVGSGATLQGSTDVYISTTASPSAFATFRSARVVAASTAGSGAPKALAWYEFGGSTWTNEGAAAKAYFTLPTAAAQAWGIFYVQDADGLRVTAGAGDTIRIGATVSSAGGYCESTTIGDSITIIAINATEWVAVNYVGSGFTCTFIFFFPFRVRKALRGLVAAGRKAARHGPNHFLDHPARHPNRQALHRRRHVDCDPGRRRRERQERHGQPDRWRKRGGRVRDAVRQRAGRHRFRAVQHLRHEHDALRSFDHRQWLYPARRGQRGRIVRLDCDRRGQPLRSNGP